MEDVHLTETHSSAELLPYYFLLFRQQFFSWINQASSNKVFLIITPLWSNGFNYLVFLLFSCSYSLTLVDALDTLLVCYYSDFLQF